MLIKIDVQCAAYVCSSIGMLDVDVYEIIVMIPTKLLNIQYVTKFILYWYHTCGMDWIWWNWQEMRSFKIAVKLSKMWIIFQVWFTTLTAPENQFPRAVNSFYCPWKIHFHRASWARQVEWWNVKQSAKHNINTRAWQFTIFHQDDKNVTYELYNN